MTPGWVISLLIVITGQLCVANEVTPPPLKEKDLLGRWEGSSAGLDWWFRMDLFPGGGYLVIERKADHDIYKLEEFKIVGRNEVTLRFSDKSHSLTKTATIKGAGCYALPWGAGELHATITESLSNSRLTSRVYFQKGDEASRDVVKMLKDTDRLMREAKRNGH
jgi:hypothetical protein